MGKKQGKVDIIPLKKHQDGSGSSRSRHQTRRAASKEALKQMQILLEDENETVEIPDDDDDQDVVPISSFPSVSKKKYKLSHRKSSDGNDREVLVLKTITLNVTNPYTDNNSLELDCWVEELEPCQIERNKKLREEENFLKATLDELVKKNNAVVIHTGEFGTILEFNDFVQKGSQNVENSNQQASIVLNNSIASTQPGYQLVMDPRLGLVLGTVQPSNSPITVQATPAEPRSTATRASKPKKQAAQAAQASSSGSTRSVATSKSSTKKLPPLTTHGTRSKSNIDATTSVTTPIAARTKISTITSSGKASESNVEGGLATGKKQARFVVDLTGDDGKPMADSKEITFNKLQGKTYPSLAVVARPYLRLIDVNIDRSKLDAKVKTVLMYSPAKFAEWLIQQGLIKSEQKCSLHGNQCKLGMYTDVSKFPHSGGYVWISECCSQKFVSVFSGSIFESSPHPPLVILKVLYHWACQTNIQNVIQWVKVDSLFVKGMYSWLRSICTVAIQTHIKPFGGSQVKVEVGVISLGTTSQDGNSRQVKVEVLGVLETSSKQIRLKAIEPLGENDRGYKKRFLKILEPLTQWVHTSSTIVTDLTVDKSTLYQLGYYNIVQTSSTDVSNSNKTVMDYLRRIVPRMFQNTLSLLSRPIIQQFLDELVWRERFGTTAMEAFDNLLCHLAEQTRSEISESIIIRLNRISSNPFRNWALNVRAPTIVTIGGGSNATTKAAEPSATKKRKRKIDKEVENETSKLNQPSTSSEVARPSKSASPDVPEQMVPLENYYYGIINNYNQSLQSKNNITLNMKCPLCKETFHNNILLMTHLFRHAHNISKGEMCKYCLASVPTVNELTKHIATAHPSETKHDRGFVCLICETFYMNPFVLGKHMSKEHCPAELPYQCGTCGYRCSNHKQSIDHFYAQHDNGPTIQCPFCLKSTTVFSSSRNIVQNMSFFLQHLNKHQKKQYARRCGKCNLWFVQKELKSDHQTKMHASQRGKTGLVPYIAPRNGIMVPKSKMDKNPCDADGINFNTLFFNVSKKLKCKECNLAMDTPKHFASFENCVNRNCRYATCCATAMQEHNTKCNKNSQISNIPEEKLAYEMFCICGYSSRDGNQLAKHLTICEKKSAYPSIGDAKNASVTRSMLDVLGLVRKPEETSLEISSEPKKATTAPIKPDGLDLYSIESEDDVVTIEEPPKKKLKENIIEDDIDDSDVIISLEPLKKTKKTVSNDMETEAEALETKPELLPIVASNLDKSLVDSVEKSLLEKDTSEKSLPVQSGADQPQNNSTDVSILSTELPSSSEEGTGRIKSENASLPSTQPPIASENNQIDPNLPVLQPVKAITPEHIADDIVSNEMPVLTNETDTLLASEKKKLDVLHSSESNLVESISVPDSNETGKSLLEPKQEDQEAEEQQQTSKEPSKDDGLVQEKVSEENIVDQINEKPAQPSEENVSIDSSLINTDKTLESNDNVTEMASVSATDTLSVTDSAVDNDKVEEATERTDLSDSSALPTRMDVD